MSAEFIFSFAVGKVFLTIFFSAIVANYGMPDKLRGRGIFAQLGWFFGFRG
jgi:hypothetical protein